MKFNKFLKYKALLTFSLSKREYPGTALNTLYCIKSFPRLLYNNSNIKSKMLDNIFAHDQLDAYKCDANEALSFKLGL